MGCWRFGVVGAGGTRKKTFGRSWVQGLEIQVHTVRAVTRHSVVHGRLKKAVLFPSKSRPIQSRGRPGESRWVLAESRWGQATMSDERRMRNAECRMRNAVVHEDARRAVVGVYAVVKEPIRWRGSRRQALLYIPAALRARRIWRAAPGARKRVWRWTGAPKKFWKFLRSTLVARSARERGGC